MNHEKVSKTISLLSALFLIVSLAACSSSAKNTSNQPANTPSDSVTSGSNESSVPETPVAKTTIKLGRVGVGVGAIDAAINDGSYEKAGITVEKQVFSSGTDAIAALIGGSLDLNLGSYEHVLRQISKTLM